MNDKKHRILKEIFGYDSFRAAQEEIIDNILSGRDVLAVMPTGAGKSITFQIPAIMSEGVTLVISPLISLMSDQVGALVQSGVNAAYINSSLTYAQQCRTLEDLRMGKLKIVYVAPERLETEAFLEAASHVKITMIAVDEAHCISQWGHDFRPSYLNIVDFIGKLPYRPIISAFTATATSQVKEDITKILSLKDPYSVTTGFDRKNLYFGVIAETPKEEVLLDVLKDYEGKSGIIYCATRKNTELVAELLIRKGFSAAPYHAGLSDAERARNQEDFIYDRVKIIAATNAFGMGIDKSNVSFVIHYNMPKDMEGYYQEAGRAGRDGESADCIILYSGSDFSLNKFIIEKGSGDPNKNPAEEQKTIRQELKKLNIINDYCKSAGCLRKFILNYFGEEAPNYCGNCSFCLSSAEKKDVTIEAQKILSCVYRTNGKCSEAQISQILRGAKAKFIEVFHYETLSTFGIMSEYTNDILRYMINFLIQNGYIERADNNFFTLSVTRAAVPVLKGREKIEMNLPKEKSRKAHREKKLSEEYAIDSVLMGKLRTLRSKLANEKALPAYMVFSDATLRDMCAKLPSTEYEMLGVSGVGAKKMEQYGKMFLEVIAVHLAENGESVKKITAETEKSPFEVLAEKIKDVSPSDENLPITRFVDHLIDFTGLNLKNKPIREAITSWLIKKGYLAEEEDENKMNRKTVTKHSESIGILLEKKISQAGRIYDVVVYSPLAQKFIIEHFNDIIS